MNMHHVSIGFLLSYIFPHMYHPWRNFRNFYLQHHYLVLFITLFYLTLLQPQPPSPPLPPLTNRTAFPSSNIHVSFRSTLRLNR